MSDSRAFDPLVAELPRPLDLWSYDRRGHGRTPDTDEPLGFESMLDEAVEVIEGVVGSPVHLVGHSDGASLSLLLASRRPDLVLSVCAFSANLDPAGLVEGSLTVEQLVAAVASDYLAVSPDGAEHLPVVAAKVLDLWAREPRMAATDMARIACPVLVAAGGSDSIRDDHTRAIHRSIRGARLAIVPGAGHMLIEQDPTLSADLVVSTIAAVAV
jgi:pimeloyl-ACP methyl ester carboxylesterase